MLKPKDVKAAIAFYEQSPDGQYDEIAVRALQYYLVKAFQNYAEEAYHEAIDDSDKGQDWD